MRIQAVIFDWAGTVVDYGCHAPVLVLEAIFAGRGVPLQPSESRHAMGLLKVDQIRKILALPRVKMAWGNPTEQDVQDLFKSFLPLQLEIIEQHSDVIEGVPELVEKLRSAGIAIGSTTGYTRAMIERILPKAAKQGYVPDCVVTPDDVGQGRPYPWMIFENMKRLGLYPPARCLKVGDTPSDIEEGHNAGLIAVGVSDSSSEAAVAGPESARRILSEAGADHVIATAPDLWNIMESL